MDATTHLNAENLKALKKPTDVRVRQEIFRDRVVIDIVKSPQKPNIAHRRYRFYVYVKFVYEGKEVETCNGYDGLKKAMDYATSIFNSRNKYMHKYNYQLS